MASLTLDWIQLAAAVGALQGLLLTGVAIAQRNNQTAKRLLAALVAAFTIYLASSVYYATGLIRVYPHFFGMSYHMPWIFGPLVYLYAVAASDRSWRFHRRHLLHFLPAAISVAIAAPYYFMSGADKIALFDRFVAGDVPSRLAIIDPFKFVSGIAYSSRLLSIYANTAAESKTATRTPHASISHGCFGLPPRPPAFGSWRRRFTSRSTVRRCATSS